MAGEVKRLKFDEGITVSSPLSYSTSAKSMTVYVDDASFELAEGSAQDGSFYLNSTSGKIRVYNGSSWQDAGESSRTGKAALSLGDSSKTITFSSPWPDTLYIPVVSIECDDADPIFLNYVIQNKTVNGFSIKLNAAVDSNSYIINYKVGSQA